MNQGRTFTCTSRWTLPKAIAPRTMAYRVFHIAERRGPHLVLRHRPGGSGTTGRPRWPWRRPGASACPCGPGRDPQYRCCAEGARHGDADQHRDGAQPLDGELVKRELHRRSARGKGQVLAEIDPRPYQVQLAQAQGALDENQARLDNAQADLERYQKLRERAADHHAAGRRPGSAGQQVEGAIQSSEAQVERARSSSCQLRRIVAPIDGRLGLRQVDAGNMVRSGDQNGIVVITQMRPISVIFTVPETDLPPVLEAMRANRRLAVEAWDRADDPQARDRHAADRRQPDRHRDRHDQAARDVRERRRDAVPEPVRQHPPALSHARDATVIPAAAVQRASFGDVRLRRQARRQGDDPQGHARRRPRASASPSPKGVAPGERVVLEGVDALQEGAEVEIVGTGRHRPPSTDDPARPAQRGSPAPASGQRPPGQGPAMNISRPFILRPVATALLMAALLLSGILAYRLLPVSALPQVDYPTIRILTFYPGASPEVMTSAVTAPLERQFGQMPGLDQMSSTSSGGASVITLRFSLDKALEVAEQEVQAAINAASNLLPNDLPQPPVYNKVNPADTPVLTLAVTSPTMPLPAGPRPGRHARRAEAVAAARRRPGQHRRRPAAGRAHPGQPAGAGRARPEPADAARGHRRRQRQPAEGQLRRPRALVHARRQRSAALARGLSRPDRRLPRRRAAAALATSPRSSTAPRTRRLVGVGQRPAGGAGQRPAPARRQRHRGRRPHQGAAAAAHRQPAVDADGRRPQRPHRDHPRVGDRRPARAGVRRRRSSSLVTFVFLRNIPATIIPSVVVPLSLVGTFGVMYLAGFSINNLTLMALTIATGFVVDDAIVMVENIARYLEEGATPMQAALKGAAQIGFTLVSLTDLAHRGADPAAVHGRRRRPAVPRVRHHAGGVDPDLAGRVADADADDVRAPAQGRARRTSTAGLYRLTGRFFDGIDRVVRPPARGGRCAISRSTLLVAVAHAGADGVALHHRAEGLLPGAGHRRDPGDHRGAAVGVVRGDGRAAAAPRRGPSSRSRTSRACLRSSASTARTRR